MKFLLLFCIIASAHTKLHHIKDSPTYRAAVVEYNFSINGTGTEVTQINLQNYIDIIQEHENDGIDIIVFPEATLNRKWSNIHPAEIAVYVPAETDKAIPCGKDENFSEVLTKLSCAAQQTKMYIVVNVAEKVNCNETVTGNCTENELVLFNTNVVFDRNGTIISRYRKIHLFGEHGFTESETKELGLFETDFGVKFGHFICFDLMFQQPSIQTIDAGITNIIFPTMWFSELSFLTAVQIQESYAYANNVNFLASGANNPDFGSTGSGIYSGKLGAIKSVMLASKKTVVLVADVPKIPGSPNVPSFVNRNNDKLRNPKEMDLLYLKADNMTLYKSGKVDPNKLHQTFKLVHRDIKCEIEVTLNKDYVSNSTGKSYYTYRAVAYDGVRSFEFKTGGVINCGVVACTDDRIDSCAHRFSNYNDLRPQFEISKIVLRARVPKPFYNETMKSHNIAYYPVTLLTDIYPLKPSEFSYNVADSDDDYDDIEMVLNQPQSEFLTFGVFGRTFDKDNSPLDNGASSLLTRLHLGLLPGLYIVKYLTS